MPPSWMRSWGSILVGPPILAKGRQSAHRARRRLASRPPVRPGTCTGAPISLYKTHSPGGGWGTGRNHERSAKARPGRTAIPHRTGDPARVGSRLMLIVIPFLGIPDPRTMPRTDIVQDQSHESRWGNDCWTSCPWGWNRDENGMEGRVHARQSKIIPGRP